MSRAAGTDASLAITERADASATATQVSTALAPTPSTTAIVAAFAAVYLIWGSTYLAIRIAVETLPPLLMASGRFIVAGGLMYAWLRWRGAERPTAANWRAASIVGGLLLLGGNGLVVWAEQTVPSGLAALLVATVPLWMVALNAFWPGGSRPGLREIAGLALGFFGLVVLVSPDAVRAIVSRGAVVTSAERVDIWGAIGLVVASLSWSIGSLYSRRARLPASPMLATAMEMICGGALLGIVGSGVGEWHRMNADAVSLRSIGAILYLLVFGSWIGFSAYVWLLRVAPPAKVATYAYVNPVVAVLLGWFFAGEQLTGVTIAAMALIISAVVLITTRRRAVAA